MARRSRVSRRLKRTLHDRGGYGNRGNRSLLQTVKTRATKQVLPGRHRRVNTQINGNYYIHTTRRDYACFGSGGSSATTTEARDASRTTLSAPSPSSGSSSAFA